MKLYCTYTPMYEKLFQEWCTATLEDNYDFCPQRILPSALQKLSPAQRLQAIRLKKIAHWITASQTEPVFIGCDVDIQWFGPTAPFVYSVLEGYDLALQVLPAPHGAQTGFFICRSNARTQTLWKQLYQLAEENPESPESHLLERLLNQPEAPSWVPLPAEMVWSPKDREPKDFSPPPTLLVHHAKTHHPIQTHPLQYKTEALVAVRHHVLRQRMGGEVHIGIRGAYTPNMGSWSMLNLTQKALKQRLPARFTVKNMEPFNTPVDAIVDISGFAYSDNWGKQGVTNAKKAAHIRQCYPGTPIVYLPQTWGPFEGEELQQYTRQALENAIVYARDPASMEHLKKLAPSAHLREAPDLVFSLMYVDKALGIRLLTQAGVDVSRPIIGISPNMRVYERYPDYLNTLKHYVELAYACNAQPVVLPHEVVESGYDDRQICKKFPGIGLTGSYNLYEVRSLISTCSLLIGSRFHSLVTAMTMGIPCLGTGWAHKYAELFHEFELSRWLLPMEMDAGERAARVTEAWETRHTLSQHIQTQVQQTRAQLQTMFDAVAQDLQGTLR